MKAFTEEKLVISHGKLFQTLITRSEKNTDRVVLQQRGLCFFAPVLKESSRGNGILNQFRRTCIASIATMFHTLTNVQDGDAVPLQQNIDNQNGDLRVGLRQITFTVGWYNVKTVQCFSWRRSAGDHTETAGILYIPPGLYSFNQLNRRIKRARIDLSVRVEPFDGLLTLRIPVGGRLRSQTTFCHYLVLMMDYMGGGLIVGSTVGTALSILQAQGHSKYILVSSPPREISLTVPHLHC